MTSDFDPKKDAANLKKHGVSLSEGERRFVTIGTNVFGALMVVVHAPRGEDVRIISVRKADSKERRAYEKGV